MRNEALYRARALSAMVAATLLAACGGSDDPPPTSSAPPPPGATTVTISGKALNGRLQGASACYDTNANRACDSGEPATASASDANGNFTLEVPNAQVGQHRIVVNVPATAVDTELGQAVGTAFTMLAPATGTTSAHSAAVSPLSTLVQQHMDRTGVSRDVAVAYIQAQAGLAVSPLADFSAAANADNQKASNVGKLVVLTSQQQAAALAPAVGQTDLSGAAVTSADVAKVVSNAVAEALPALAAAATTPAVAGASGAALQTALTSAATAAVQQIDLTVPEVVASVGVAKLPPSAGTSGNAQAAASLRVLQYTNAQNWFIRSQQASAADNTPDANNRVRTADVRTRMAPYAFEPTRGVAQSFAFGNTLEASGDLHWNGSGWAACALGQRNSSTVRDAQGRNSYDFCDGYEKGISVLTTQDIAGQTLASVLTDKIRRYPGGSNGVPFSQWGPANLALLGTGTLPAGSQIAYTQGTVTESALAYDVRSSNQVLVFSAAVAAGGDARTGTPACAGTTTSLATASLEEMVARAPGQPCIFGAQTNADGTSTNPRYGWGTTSMSLGTLANANTLPAGTGNYYTTTARLRVSFAASGNATTYHSCYERRADGGTQNCSVIGTGTYSIATLGDARVMSFANLPATVLGLDWTRVFVERGGRVYYGYKNKVGQAFDHLSLNMPAANAYLSVLGLPIIQPADAPQALTGAEAANAATMKGVWYFSDAFGTGLLRVGDNGEYLLAGTDAPGATFRPGYERGWLDVDAAGKPGWLVALDTDGDNGLSHSNPAATISVTDTTFTFTENGVTEGFDGRLPDSGTGIVGMWALGSATDLKATQFVFFANGKLLSIHPAETEGPCVAARQGPPGIEWSDYTFNPATGALRIFNKIYDTSGCTGLFDSAAAVPNTEANLVLTIAADGKTFTVPVDGGTVTLTGYRIAPNP